MAQPAPSPAKGPAEPHGFDAVVTAAKALADGVRARVLRVLKEDSYGVMELARILEIAQPALSHHLKVLHQAGLVTRRREGNTIFYRRAPAPAPLHIALLASVDGVSLPEGQLARIEAVHRDRGYRSEAFFAEHAGDFASNQARISEARVYAGSVLDIVDRHRFRTGAGRALEIGPGEGELLAPLARRFAYVVGVDSSAQMLARCAERIGAMDAVMDNVELRHGDFAAPRGERFDLVVAGMVVHHLPSPQRFFRQAQRMLEPRGLLVVAELCRHDHEWARSACGDVWLGFEPGELAEWADNAGLQTGEAQFLAQKNGFRIQIQTFQNNQP